MFGLATPEGVAGDPVTDLLSDRFSNKWLLIILFLIQPIAPFSLLRVRLLMDVIPFVLLYSISYGGIIVVRATITGDYYGREHYGKIFGTIQGIITSD